eukprot:15763400-Heterocapsa_arctica.AAC.1
MAPKSTAAKKAKASPGFKTAAKSLSKKRLRETQLEKDDKSDAACVSDAEKPEQAEAAKGTKQADEASEAEEPEQASEGGEETLETQKRAKEEKRVAQRLMLSLTGKKNASEEQKRVGILYRAEGKTGSDVKDALLANFLADKSCR